MSKITLKEKREEATNIVFEIENELKSAKGLITQLKREFENANKESSKIKALSPKISSTLDNAEAAIVDLRKKRDELKRTLNSTEKYLNGKFKNLKNQIDDPKNGLNSKINKGKKFDKSLISLNKNYEKASLRLSSLRKESTDKISNIRKNHKELTKIYNYLKILNQKIADIHSDIESSKMKIDAAKNVILENEIEVVKKSNKVSELEKSSKESFEKISDLKSDSEINLDKIKEIYEIAANTGLGGEFDKRRKYLENNLKSWKGHIITSTSLLLIFFISFFIYQLYIVDFVLKAVEINEAIFSRILMSTPLIFYIAFSTAQYSRSKSLYEKYSYKTVLSFSIEAHIKLLLDIGKNEKREIKEEIINFILSGFKKIYREPYKKNNIPSDKKTNTLENIPELINDIHKKVFEKT